MFRCLNASFLAAITPANAGAGGAELSLIGVVLVLLAFAGLICLVRLLGSQARQLRALETLAAERRNADATFVALSRTQFSTEQGQHDSEMVDEKKLQQARALLADAVVTLQRLKQQ